MSQVTFTTNGVPFSYEMVIKLLMKCSKYFSRRCPMHRSWAKPDW